MATLKWLKGRTFPISEEDARIVLGRLDLPPATGVRFGYGNGEVWGTTDAEPEADGAAYNLVHTYPTDRCPVHGRVSAHYYDAYRR